MPYSTAADHGATDPLCDEQGGFPFLCFAKGTGDFVSTAAANKCIPSPKHQRICSAPTASMASKPAETARAGDCLILSANRGRRSSQAWRRRHRFSAPSHRRNSWQQRSIWRRRAARPPAVGNFTINGPPPDGWSIRKRCFRRLTTMMKPRIGILTSGGDCPGLNAVLRGVVLAAEKLGWEVVGFRDGFEGLLPPGDYVILDRASTDGHHGRWAERSSAPPTAAISSPRSAPAIVRSWRRK